MQLLDLGHGYFVERKRDPYNVRRELWVVYRHRDSKMRRSGMYLPASLAVSPPHARETLISAGAPQSTLAAFDALEHGPQKA